ncbi:hypothetical protein LIER_36513 [Lithospermum erythrorhizon]|uniref:Reverse transcriptase n=1 Tax=Lithospermum erythrorhizon TaxID=34254 RepID=A0AAV3P732_LITER
MVIGDFNEEKQVELDVLQRGVITEQSKVLPIGLTKELDKIQETNDLFWRQRAKVEWRVKGDLSIRTIHGLALQLYQQLFAAGNGGLTPILGHLHTPVLVGFVFDLPFIEEEVKKCLFAMKFSKSPGPDGMSTCFFQYYWDIVGQDMCRMCFLLPIQICKELHSLIANYWWDSDGSNMKIHWSSWKNRSKPKGAGGLGFRELHQFNRVWLYKQVWRIIIQPRSTLAKVYKAKYFSQENYWSASLGCKPSFIWSSHLSVRDIMFQAVSWHIGNGKQINICKALLAKPYLAQ